MHDARAALTRALFVAIDHVADEVHLTREITITRACVDTRCDQALAVEGVGPDRRAHDLRALRELRSIAHIIDMHQLTKDPERTDPDRPMTARELGRYLDYCSEMLSLTGKVAALYVQDFEDDVALQAVNEIEDLTTGLARKIWQKLSIVTSDA